MSNILVEGRQARKGSLSKHHCPGIFSVRQASPAKEFTLIASSPLASLRPCAFSWSLYPFFPCHGYLFCPSSKSGQRGARRLQSDCTLQNVGIRYPNPLACKPCLRLHDGARYVASPTWRTGCWRSVASTQAQITLVNAGGILPDC